jgi:glycosyltransferase involved in cell wall biosynthesis
MGTPSVSAIICTFNRAELLSRALDSIVAQTWNKSDFEVIIIDDGSSDHTRKVVDSFERRFPIRYAYQANAGLGSAKNHGIYCSRAPILLFLDDDDLCSSTLFAEHLKTHAKYPDGHFAVLGYTALDPPLAQKPLLHYVTEVGCHLFSYRNLKDGDVLDYTCFWGGRSSCKRKFLIEHGVFNPVFRFGCEDIELGYRLSKHNLRVVYNAQAVSTMVRDITFDAFCARLIRQGESQYVFSQLHPDAEVLNWAEVIGAEEEWQSIRTVCDGLVRSARELDRIVNLKIELGLLLDDVTLALLHRAYRDAFRACKLKGINNGRSKAIEAANHNGPVPRMNVPAISARGGSEEIDSQPNSRCSDSNFLSESTKNGPRDHLSAWEQSIFKEVTDMPPKIHGGGTITWGLGGDVLNYIFARVNSGFKTLETGCGVSTIVFALKQTMHFAITPSADEMERIKQYCVEKGIPVQRVFFRIGKSEELLPSFEHGDFDLVLIDGCHAFPLPFLDWFYLSQRLKLKGLLIVDDTQLWPCRILCDFLMAEPEWAVESIFDRSIVFRKLKNVPAKEWTHQPFVVERSNRPGN